MIQISFSAEVDFQFAACQSCQEKSFTASVRPECTKPVASYYDLSFLFCGRFVKQVADAGIYFLFMLPNVLIFAPGIQGSFGNHHFLRHTIVQVAGNFFFFHLSLALITATVVFVFVLIPVVVVLVVVFSVTQEYSQIKQ